MPRNVRNFWIETRTRKDGDYEDWREHATGPLGKLGTFTTSIKIRHEGQPLDVLTLEGFADEDGYLTIVVFADGRRVHTVHARRDKGTPARDDPPRAPSFCSRCGTEGHTLGECA
jgi:hypothetical protein